MWANEGDQAVRRMRWTPESVETMFDSSPTLRANAASSNGFCIWLRPKRPRSPPSRADEQSLSVLASLAKVALRSSASRSVFSWPLRISSASSLDRVMLAWRQDAGRRLPLCLMRRCDALILSPLPPAPLDALDPPPGVVDCVCERCSAPGRVERSDEASESGTSQRDSCVAEL